MVKLFSHTKTRLNVKKGTPLDLITIMTTLFILGITLLVSYTFFYQASSNGSLNQTTQSTAIVGTVLEKFKVWDNIFLAVLIGFSLTSIIASAVIRTTPFFFFISIILLAIVLILGGVISNSFEQAGNSQLSVGKTVFPKMFYIMDHLLIYLLIMGVSIIIALYSVRGREAF